jgi:multiple sugar transport system ATP-binding protein
MRAEIKKLHIAEEATTVYVTHDQVEAMAMGDRIVVMSAAEVQQAGTPAEVYYDPANLFVARFIGSPGMNLLAGKYTDGVVHLPGENRYPVPERWRRPLAQQLEGEDIIIGFRPEAAQADGVGELRAAVYASDLHGAFNMLHLSLGNEGQGEAYSWGRFSELQGVNVIHIRGQRGAGHQIGENVHFELNPEMVRFFSPRNEVAIIPEA